MVHLPDDLDPETRLLVEAAVSQAAPADDELLDDGQQRQTGPQGRDLAHEPACRAPCREAPSAKGAGMSQYFYKSMHWKQPRAPGG
jgi:hypothetical protein